MGERRRAAPHAEGKFGTAPAQATIAVTLRGGEIQQRRRPRPFPPPVGGPFRAMPRAPQMCRTAVHGTDVSICRNVCSQTRRGRKGAAGFRDFVQKMKLLLHSVTIPLMFLSVALFLPGSCCTDSAGDYCTCKMAASWRRVTLVEGCNGTLSSPVSLLLQKRQITGADLAPATPYVFPLTLKKINVPSQFFSSII